MEKINILGIDYKIKYINIISKECLTLGQIDYLNQEIKILDELEDDIKKKQEEFFKITNEERKISICKGLNIVEADKEMNKLYKNLK